LSRRTRFVGARREVEADEVPAHIMLRSRRGQPVYVVYDEDTFLAAPNGASSCAFARQTGSL